VSAALRPPTSLDAPGRAAWKEACATLRAQGEDPAVSAGAILRYAGAVSMAASVRAEWVAAGRPGVIVGPRGRISAHPLPVLLARLERDAADLAEPLGLTPAARRRMARGIGRPTGAASAPDRTARRALRAAPVVPLRSSDDG
jgi:phage terminase small subunit